MSIPKRRGLFNYMYEDPLIPRSVRKQARTIKKQPVEIHIPETGMWSGDNHLGVVTEVLPDANLRQTILKMPEWGPPCVWTVTLGEDWTLVPNQYFEVTALVNFGVGGSTQTAEVTWLSGTSFSLVMNAINIIAQYEAEYYGGPAPFIPPDDLKLSVQVGRGTIPRGRAPVRLKYYTIAASAFPLVNGGLISIPPFSRSLEVLTNQDPAVVNPYTANYQIEFWPSPAAVSGRCGLYSMDWYGNKSLDIPIPSHARYLLVRRMLKDPNPAYLQLQFNLCL